jgi:hypothetical protein
MLKMKRFPAMTRRLLKTTGFPAINDEVSSDADEVSSSNDEEALDDDDVSSKDDEEVAVEDHADSRNANGEVVVDLKDEVSSNDEEVPGNDEVDRVPSRACTKFSQENRCTFHCHKNF